jgi:ATP-dependent Clp protease ATP-binding subunit ClpA
MNERVTLLFPEGVFSPTSITDPRVHTVLTAAAEWTGEAFRLPHIFAAALQHAESNVLATVAQAMRPGASLQDLQQSWQGDRSNAATINTAPWNRGAFSANTLQALDAFDAAIHEAAGALDAVALELLLHYTLAFLDESERQELAALDTQKTSNLFRLQVEAFVRRASTSADICDPSGTGQEPRPENPSVRLGIQVATAEDLTQRAQSGSLPEVLPFANEPDYERLFDSLARILHRRRANHVLLVGERGVGKSMIVAELARRAAAGQIPFLQEHRFLSVDCRYVPLEESRIHLAALLGQVVDQSELVVCISGLLSLLRGERVASNKPILLAALSHARCRLIALLTPREFDELISDDSDFAEFFSRVDVQEPEPGVAAKLLRHLAHGLEEKFGVTIAPDAVQHVVTLSANYILNDQLPAKAVTLLERACEEIDYVRSQDTRACLSVTVDDVIRLVSEQSGVPQETLRGIAERSDYEQSLGEMIFGQEHAVRVLATELGLIKAGMTDPHKPASVLLFLGQTGTGKTEMAKAVARFYSTSKRLKTYTLGNCVEPHSVATIIGVPPGYVGHDQGGRLVNDLNADPYGVFLLDEADKAHPDVLQPFLNLFDEGWVCDQRGVKAYANKSIFILTSNVGQRMIAELVQQGHGPDEIAGRMKEALGQIRHSKSDRPVFTPEFLGRIKRIIVFNPLTRDALAGIAGKLVRELQETWTSKRGKFLVVPETLVAYLGEQAHRRDEKSRSQEGGRLVRKLLSDWIEACLQRAITQRPADYKQCDTVQLEFTPPEKDDRDLPDVAITVSFVRSVPTSESAILLHPSIDDIEDRALDSSLEPDVLRSGGRSPTGASTLGDNSRRSMSVVSGAHPDSLEETT